jgi:hypothetical protein
MTGRPFSEFTDEHRRQQVAEDPLQRPLALPPGVFGPWRPGIPENERWAGLRALAALSAVFAGMDHPVVAALRRAELEPAAAGEALALFDRLPTLRRRQVIATYARIMRPAEPREAS